MGYQKPTKACKCDLTKCCALYAEVELSLH